MPAPIIEGDVIKILLVRPNYKSHIITPPIGLGYLASYLKKNGIEANILDGLRDNLNNESLKKLIVNQQPDAVGITCLTAFYSTVVSLSRMLKQAGLRVIIGGVHPTVLPFDTLRDSGCDYIIAGEGEKALLQLARNHFNHQGIRGVYANKDIATREPVLKKAEVVQNLDSLPFPDWEQMAPGTYPKAPHGAIVKNYPVGVITSSRGCPFRCTFCASPKLCDRRIRYRSPESVVDEIKLLVQRFGVKEIHFEDDNFTLKRSRVMNICRLIVEEKLDISWACPNGIRADKVDLGLLSLMKESGCYSVAYGVESANQAILDTIKKQERLEAMEKAIELTAKVGISCQGFFVFGLPGESRETIEKSISFAKHSKLERAQFLILDVLPGSELWETLSGSFSPNWAKNSYKEPEWLPGNLTKIELLRAQSRAFREFYLKSPRRLFKMMSMIRPGQIRYILRRLLEYRIIKN